LLLCLPLLNPSVGHAAETVTLRSDLWCPYSCDPKSDKPGYMIEIARAIFGAAGIEVDYQLLPWKRVVSSLRAGEIDGAVGVGRHEISGMIVPSRSLGANTTTLALPDRSTFAFQGIASLEQLKIGIVTDYAFDDGGEIDAYVRAHSTADDGRLDVVYGADAQMQNMQKLLNGRIDAIMDAEQVLRFAMTRLSPPPSLKLIRLRAPIETTIAFSPKNHRAKVYADMLSDGVEALRRSGRLKTILDRYNLTDWDRN
jgi:polar amino acid transport system substrate-binding protein